MDARVLKIYVTEHHDDAGSPKCGVQGQRIEERRSNNCEQASMRHTIIRIQVGIYATPCMQSTACINELKAVPLLIREDNVLSFRLLVVPFSDFLPILALIIQSCLAHSESTTMDNYTIAPVLAADLPTVAHFIFSSQLTQPTNQFLFSDWPNESAQVSLYLSGLEKTIDRPSIEMLKAVDNSTGEMVASLILERKTPEIEDEEASTEPEKPISAPLGLNAEFYEFMKRALAGVQENMAQVDHFGKHCFFSSFFGALLMILSLDFNFRQIFL